MSGIQVTVGVDSNSKLGISLQGDENLLFALIGGLEYAKEAVINRIKMRNGEVLWGKPSGKQEYSKNAQPVTVPIEEEGVYPTEQNVTKEKAIEATEYAIASLNTRLEVMKKSPDTATFTIDPDLLAKL